MAAADGSITIEVEMIHQEQNKSLKSSRNPPKQRQKTELIRFRIHLKMSGRNLNPPQEMRYLD